MDDKMMNKAERILEFIKKISEKENISYEAAEQLAITREFIKYIENDNEMR